MHLTHTPGIPVWWDSINSYSLALILTVICYILVGQLCFFWPGFLFIFFIFFKETPVSFVFVQVTLGWLIKWSWWVLIQWLDQNIRIEIKSSMPWMPVQWNTQKRSTSARVATACRAYTLTQTYSRYNVTSLSKKVNSSTLDFSNSSTQGVSLCFSPECGSCVRVHNGMCFFLTLYMRVFFVLLQLLVFLRERSRSRHQLAVVLTKQVGWMSPGCDSDSTTPHCQLPTAEAGRWRRSPVGWLVEMSDVSLHGH